jgi:uncharacterized membrane protein
VFAMFSWLFGVLSGRIMRSSFAARACWKYLFVARDLLFVCSFEASRATIMFAMVLISVCLGVGGRRYLGLTLPHA